MPFDTVRLHRPMWWPDVPRLVLPLRQRRPGGLATRPTIRNRAHTRAWGAGCALVEGDQSLVWILPDDGTYGRQGRLDQGGLIVLSSVVMLLALQAATKAEMWTASNRQYASALLGGIAEKPIDDPATIAWLTPSTSTSDPELAEQVKILRSAIGYMEIWKKCTRANTIKYAKLAASPTEISDAAIGKCAAPANLYRNDLLTMTTSKFSDHPRVVFDISAADGMVTSLKEIWRPRLMAIVLDARLK